MHTHTPPGVISSALMTEDPRKPMSSSRRNDSSMGVKRQSARMLADLSCLLNNLTRREKVPFPFSFCFVAFRINVDRKSFKLDSKVGDHEIN